MKDIILILGTGTVTTLINWVLNKRSQGKVDSKTQAETDAIYQQVYSRIYADQRNAIEDWKTRYEEATARYEEAIHLLRQEVEHTKALNAQLQNEIDRLKVELDTLLNNR